MIKVEDLQAPISKRGKSALSGKNSPENDYEIEKFA